MAQVVCRRAKEFVSCFVLVSDSRNFLYLPRLLLLSLSYLMAETAAWAGFLAAAALAARLAAIAWIFC
jgi:hypothetical protein